MSLQNGAIVRDNLAFYFDARNTQRSWKGKPTTNVIVNPEALWTGTTYNLNGSGYLYDATSAPNHSLSYDSTVARPIGGTGILRYYTGANTGYKYWAVRGYVPSAGTYTFSYYARLRGNNMSAQLSPNQLWRDTGTDKSVSGDWNPTYTTEWKRYTTTGYVTTYLDYFPVHGSAVPGGYELEMCGFQLEAGSFSTPFIAGSRSSTQSLVDIMGIHSIPTTSLTYNSDNTFSFTGPSNRITGVMPAGYTSSSNDLARSWEVVVKPTANLSFAGLFGHVTSSGCTYYCNGGVCIANGKYAFNWYDNAAYQFLDSGVAATNGVWAHVVGTWDPLDLKTRVYVNGELRATFGSATNLNYNGSSNEFQVGYLSANGDAFTGSIDIIKYYYGKTLSAAEIKQNFNAVRGRYGI